MLFFFWGEHTHKENVIPSVSGTEQRKLETWQKQNLKVPLHLLYLEILLDCGLNFIFKRGRGWKQGETCLLKIFLGLPFGLKLCGFYTSGGDWSTPSLCLLVFSVIPSHSSETWIHLFWARRRGTQPLYFWEVGDAFTFSTAAHMGWGVTRPTPGAPPPAWHSFS